jgi:hypothetical protein
MQVKKMGALVGAAVLGLALPVLAGAATPAAAAPKIQITPPGPYKDGQTISVKLSGYPANAAIAVGQCPKGRVVEDAGGNLTTTLKIVVGDLGLTKPPAYSCSNSTPCTLNASTIGATIVSATPITLKYVTTSTPKPTATATPKPTATKTATPKPSQSSTPKPTATATPKPTTAAPTTAAPTTAAPTTAAPTTAAPTTTAPAFTPAPVPEPVKDESGSSFPIGLLAGGGVAVLAGAGGLFWWLKNR